jgi:hypothetical protein
LHFHTIINQNLNGFSKQGGFMSGVKNVGAKPVSQTQNQDPLPPPVQPEPQPKTTATSNNTMSQSGKAAKTTESGVSGEAMRQKVLKEAEDLAKPLVDAMKEQNSDSSDFWANAGKEPEPTLERESIRDKKKADVGKPASDSTPQPDVQKAGSDSKKVDAAPMSPAGVAYKPEARVPDNTPIFTDGKVDREKVLQNLTQHDQSAKTTEDKDRCGGTAVISSAINNGGDQGLLKLTGAMKKNLPAESLKDLNEIEEKIKNKTATHGDLGKLSEMIHKGYAVDDKNTGRKGILDGDMHSLYTAAGLKPPATAGLPEKIFQKGQSWPVNLDTDKDGSPNHWVVAGKDEKGRAYIYDPESTPGKPQIHYQGSPEYDSYIKQMRDTSSGFAPITKQQADAAREKYDRENVM